ncbi:hypothetical protein A8C75_05580 [Marinobacterium aestuarii]|uniref:Uncharacterized protein n=1 Tax=Marinobacterium aestuarii TaxID=1821621 RepID=A0A1A9EW87_9GAMM|nr:hypothetical protein [Marinobacterium aestuarii]ANG62010.1 hypothetical protein A8C75_05580 [Marinobacterium aestuarii]
MQIGSSFRLPAPRAALKRRQADRSATEPQELVREGEWEPRLASQGQGRRRDAQADAHFASLDYHSQRALLAYDATQSRNPSGLADVAFVDVLI